MRNNDHNQHQRGQQQNRRGPGQGQQRGHQQQQAGRRPNPQGNQGYYNPEQHWGSRGYGGGGGNQGVEDWDRPEEEMDRGQYTAPLGHGDDTDWHDDEAFGAEFIGDEPNRFGPQGPEGRSGMGGYGTHGGGAHGGQWGAQGSRGAGYGGQGMGGGPGGYYQGSGQDHGRDPGQRGFGQRQGGPIGGPASGGMGWRGEQGWQGSEVRTWSQPGQGQQQRFERGPKGYKRSDERVKDDVSDRINQLQHVDSSDVEVDVKNGEVTLTGTVPNRVMKWQLENLVETIGGVTEVNNQLRIRREGSFMQQVQSTAQSAISALKPDQDENARRGGTTGSQDTGPVTNKK
jgi:hypothetical protein